MNSIPNRFRAASTVNQINNNIKRQQVVYDEDIFGDNAVAENVVEKKTIEFQLNRRVSKPIAHVGPMLSKPYVRQQPFHPYQRPNNVVPSTNTTLKVNRNLTSETNNYYKLVKRIGHGTYGEVFKGIDTRTNLPVAIKRLLCKIKSVSVYSFICTL